MAGVTWTQTDIDNLQAAIASGTLTVQYDGPPKRLLTYQSTSDMLKVLAVASQFVNGAAGKKNYRLTGYRKGFDDDRT